jgi:hypothetical protein
MGAPNTGVGYNLATTRRGDHEVCMDMWWHWGWGARQGIENLRERIELIKKEWSRL